MRPVRALSSIMLVLLVLFSSACFSEASPLKAGFLPYVGSMTEAQKAWAAERFTMQIHGPQPSDEKMQWMIYNNLYVAKTIEQLLEFKDYVQAAGGDYHETLLHAKVDWTFNLSTAWSELDKFGIFEGANGIMKTSDDVTFSDVTTAAYTGSVTLEDMVYISYEEPFADINFIFSTAGSDVSAEWQYWNGSSWSLLSVTDGTSNFASNGLVTFIPPSDWAARAVNSSRTKYFVRLVVGSATTSPVTSKIYGDDWLNGSANACRGWDATDSNIVNTGVLAYNPTPPGGASAKFRYQAMVTTWGPNRFAMNPADVQNVGGKDTRFWAKFLAEWADDQYTTNGYTGIMLDDGAQLPEANGLLVADTDFTDKTTNDWLTEATTRYQAVVDYAAEINPNVMIGINNYKRGLALKGQWNLAEYHVYPWQVQKACIEETPGYSQLAYSDYLPANNPTGAIGFLIYGDTADGNIPGRSVAWDRANRGPIISLASHYIGLNNNVVFGYFSGGGYIYNKTDEVKMKDDSTINLATDPVPAVEDVENWYTYFPAMGVDIGVPDSGGYNGGDYGLAWKTPAEIGGVQNVWRRDYTGAIVLVRPAAWNTTDEEYTTPSSPMDLGGTFYPLKADGTTGAAITSISLRAAEGGILLKQPILQIGFSGPKNLRVVK